MKWAPCALALAVLTGLGVSEAAWGDRGRGGQSFAPRHDTFQPVQFRSQQQVRPSQFRSQQRVGSSQFRSRQQVGSSQFRSHRQVAPSHFKSHRQVIVNKHAVPVHKPHFVAKHRVHHRSARIGVFIGAPLFWHWPPPHYAYPAYAPVVAVPAYAPPPTYVERGTDYGEPGDPRYWYYCQDPAGYYPYVNSCPGGWQRVMPTPPDLQE